MENYIYKKGKKVAQAKSRSLPTLHLKLMSKHTSFGTDALRRHPHICIHTVPLLFYKR